MDFYLYLRICDAALWILQAISPSTEEKNPRLCDMRVFAATGDFFL